MELLVDADIICYTLAFIHEVTYEWDSDVKSKSINLSKAQSGIDTFIQSLLESTETPEATFCFTSSPNFRYNVLSTYKHNRRHVEKPELLNELRKYITENYKTKVKPRLEADDVMGILATISPNKYIIASIDKDLLQIPGLHYNWKTQDLKDISQEEADFFFFRQVLMGDSTDGYKGCPGIGPKKSLSILESVEPENYWDVIVKTYESKGLTKEDALVQARVARILRKSDWDFKRKTYKLWEPKGLRE